MASWGKGLEPATVLQAQSKELCVREMGRKPRDGGERGRGMDLSNCV